MSDRPPDSTTSSETAATAVPRSSEKRHDGLLFPPLMAIAVLVIVLLVVLAPFLDKAYHLDDPVYLWIARHIQAQPLDFYGFSVNWYGKQEPVSQVNKNPPLASYYLALVTALFGWAERTLHLSMLVPAIATMIGTYQLASTFCSRPSIAVLIGTLSPGFLVSSTTVMSDVPMLALWVWSLFLWIRGLKGGSFPLLAASAMLIALSSLTKYFAISLVPLLFLYSLATRRSLGAWTLFLGIPIVILAVYQYVTHDRYGSGLLLDAATYAGDLQRDRSSMVTVKAFVGLSFLGGCCLAALFYAPMLLRGRTLGALALVMLVFMVMTIATMPDSSMLSVLAGRPIDWSFLVHLYLFTLTAAFILLLSLSDAWRHRDADSLLLALWVVGTLLFAGFLNWTTNVRSVLPASPAVGILIVRGFDRMRTHPGALSLKGALLPLAPALLLALTVASADQALANAAREEAADLVHRYRSPSSTIWFQGHWGFQYYMEAAGCKPLDLQHSDIQRGDLVIIPSNNTSINADMVLSQRSFQLVRTSERRLRGYASTMSAEGGAGFYTDLWGPLPFRFGPAPAERYHVFRAATDIAYRNQLCMAVRN